MTQQIAEEVLDDLNLINKKITEVCTQLYQLQTKIETYLEPQSAPIEFPADTEPPE